MLDIQELSRILNFINMSKTIYDRSEYKYGVYKKVLAEMYPRHSEYKLKKIFDNLICLGYIDQIPFNKSYRYKWNAKTLDAKPILKDKPFILVFE
jgi:hypothetical protein